LDFTFFFFAYHSRFFVKSRQSFNPKNQGSDVIGFKVRIAAQNVKLLETAK